MKNNVKMKIAFVIFLLAVSAMDSQMYITSGVLAITSSIYLLISIRKEQRNVHGTRGSRTYYWVEGTDGQMEGPYLEGHPKLNERSPK